MDRICSSMENFKKYILDDTVILDHTYLWDVISLPNKKLFADGVNIIIIEDNAGRVEMTCPTSYAGRKLYDKMKKSILLIKKGNIYEPVYYFVIKGNTIKKRKEFQPYDDRLVFKIEQTNKYLSRCIPEDSKTELYKFTENMLLQTLIRKIGDATKKEPTIKYLCIDYNGKTVGMHVVYKKHEGFIPCYPSAINTSYKLKFIYEYKWKSYKSTTDFLAQIKQLDKDILCQPTLLIEADDLVIGLLTETNQFIKIVPPEKIDSDLKKVSGSDYIDQEKAIFNSTENSDINDPKYIYLEQQFYNVFRTLVRQVITHPTNKQLRKDIIAIISKKNGNSANHLDGIVDILHKLVDHKISFITYEPEILNSLNTISTCNNCKKQYCLTTSDDECNLLLPMSNLMNGQDNRIGYFITMADQLLRYTRIQQFILNPNKYLNLANINYEVNDNEKLVLTSKLNDFLAHIKTLEESDSNSYIINNAYDNMNPPDSTAPKTIEYYTADHYTDETYTDDNPIKELDIAPEKSIKFKKIKLSQ